MIDLVLGGNKSGKSDFGLELLQRCPPPRSMVVTGKSRDLAFRDQIMAHRQSRDQTIPVRETGLDLCLVLRELVDQGGVLVDSLDFWMFMLAQEKDQAGRQAACAELLDLLQTWQGGRLIVVSTEMGLGPLAFDGGIRAFARDLGQLNREIARVSASVYLVVAGLAQQLK